MRPVVLVIAGLDPAGGAGLLADARTVEAHGAWSAGVAATLTAQTIDAVSRVEPVATALVIDQLRAAFDELPVAAVKVGLVVEAATIEALAVELGRRRVPLVVDPVAASTSGTRFHDLAAVDALRASLLPVTTLATPNVGEARRLARRADAGAREAGRAWLDAGASNVLVTGGDEAGDRCVDWLLSAAAETPFERPRVPTDRVHGSGCVFASSIAARLAHGDSVERAVAGASEWIASALRRAVPIGCGGSPDSATPAPVAAREERT